MKPFWMAILEQKAETEIPPPPPLSPTMLLYSNFHQSRSDITLFQHMLNDMMFGMSVLNTV